MSCPISDNSFENCIPHSIRREIKYAVDRTDKTNREQSLTFCRLEDKDRIFVSSHTAGNNNSTEVLPCNKAYGKSVKIGDVHSHPTNDKRTIGITPSTADLVSTVIESKQYGIPQISCIIGPHIKHISCYQAKEELLNNPEKIKNYKRALNYVEESGINDVHPFIRESVAKDFNHIWYDRKTFKRVNPTPKDVVKDAFGKSKNLHKFKYIHDLDKDPACVLIEDLNYPSGGKVAEACRRALEVRNFLGWRF